MPPRSALPLSVKLCTLVVDLATLLVPEEKRNDWRNERLAEIWHRWQFLDFAHEWTLIQKLLLLRSAGQYLADAAWSLTTNETFRGGLARHLRLPRTLFVCIAIGFGLLTYFSKGLPACRQMIRLLMRPGADELVLLWLQPFGDLPHGVPLDLIPKWRQDAGKVASFAPFTQTEATFSVPGFARQRTSVVTTDENFLPLMRTRPLLGNEGVSGSAGIDFSLWAKSFHRDRQIIGKPITIGKKRYVISCVLPPDFSFLSRQPSVYVFDPAALGRRAMVIVRLSSPISVAHLVHQLSRKAADTNYYFFLFHPRLRSAKLLGTVVTPLVIFCICVLASGLMITWISKVRPRNIRVVLAHENRAVTIRRALFFVTKLVFSLAFVFAAGLEWARTQDTVLLTWTDGGSGPFISWLYVLGTMAVFFLVVADGRARCPVCLRLLAFPVRIGSPGSLFLNWSGTELYCSEGHGVLHVPHMSTSWDESSHQWVGLEESWRILFAEEEARPSQS